MGRLDVQDSATLHQNFVQVAYRFYSKRYGVGFGEGINIARDLDT